MNIYFDFSFDVVSNEYSLSIFYRKYLFNKEAISQIIDFIYYGYKYLNKILDLKIQDLTLNYLISLEEKTNFDKNLIAKF